MPKQSYQQIKRKNTLCQRKLRNSKKQQNFVEDSIEFTKFPFNMSRSEVNYGNAFNDACRNMNWHSCMNCNSSFVDL